MRTRVYVDGFNLYYGALKGTPYKWLDLVELSRQLVDPADTIEMVKYFTARVSGAADPGAPGRQQRYLSALKSRPEIQVYFGRFLSKTIWRPLVNFPVAGATIDTPSGPAQFAEASYDVNGGTLLSAATVPIGVYPQKGVSRKRSKTSRPASNALIVECHAMEEKGSDVNLAAHLLNDAWKGEFEAALVISNDTDLCAPIQMVASEHGLPVYVACPHRHFTLSPELAAVSTYQRHIRTSMLASAQFPNSLSSGAVVKPAVW